MKVLITGAAGFIGGNFSHYMTKKYPKYEIVLDNLTYAGNLKTLESIIKKNFRFMKGDISDKNYIHNLFEIENLILLLILQQNQC